MISVGKTIREKRQAKNLLLRQLAAILEIDVAILSKIERGERIPSQQQIICLAKALDIDQKVLLKNRIAEKIFIELSDEENPIEILKMIEKEINKKTQALYDREKKH